MRLTHIKLSGFKSFVDPTAIPVPGQLVAVIGPNGCGKSNVIDAVRWVLGESSAKQLRGESMQDVIFNGSSTRKPVSRASVELVFDNGDGQLTGPWGQYAEVAIKRVLTRQGESSYYINNQQVRRRDITDLFLGTGVGARGYAVIEQGMISRIIEARPEELRAYLEEAAGVSKYKDRRRETENRLADTRDNLDRIGDLRQELERQVEKLTEQAEVAAQFHDLKGALTHKQNLLALARREEAARTEAAARAELARIETEEAAQEAALTHLDTELETVREQHFAASDAVHEAQQALFEANAQLARLEEAQRHREQSRARLTRELASASSERQTLAESRAQVAAQLDDWLPRHEEAQLKLEEAQLALEDGADALPRADGAFRQADQALTQLTSQQANLTRERDLGRQRIEHLNQALQQLATREAALTRELTDLNLPEPAALAAAEAEVARARAALDAVRARVVADEAKLADLAAEREKLDETLAEQRAQLARAEAEAAALQAVLAREAAGEQLAGWLAQQGLAEAPALWQSLDVDPTWRVALEAVLAERLTARAGQLPDTLPPAPLCLVDNTTHAVLRADRSWPALLDCVKADDTFAAVLADWLAGVYRAETLEQALARRAELAAGECWVTPQGHRVGAASVSFHAAASDDGVMARKGALDAALQRAAELQPALDAGQRRRETLQSQSAMLAEAVRAQKGALTRLEAELNAVTLEQVKLDQAARQGAARLAAIEAERQRIADERTHAAEEIDEAGIGSEEAALMLEELVEALEDARLARLNAETGLQLARNKTRDAERLVHEARLELTTAEQKVGELARRAKELEERDDQLAERLETLAEEALTVDEAVPEEALQLALEQRDERDTQLAAVRDRLNGLTEQLRQLGQRQHDVSAALPALRNARADWLLKHQEARLGVERFSEELKEAGADEGVLLADLTDAVKPNTLAAEIARLARALENLGAVNLAALDELQQARERGDYLASQSDDLLQAMATLEEAIAKIDGETRDMLQSTYDAVNAKMSEFFPTLFGGGRAELVLTGEDLLDAGVQIIAQPPGKKNSTIHLLSGGEKALTAMSLVFSLFSLNPAPFCLLDEVDAPLDDANTSRFCDLVKRMAERTQFLYISHNRLTMEMAEQLVGVTMQEQGVSRIVAVDIVEALQMRETA
ncbi:chromosome segregation protein SMC [Pseudogulbenkiania ferrooxidans]|uniref:Chromosome partition protein Smc n=1 Tax=Pseudogulbenkiania ferrooxidans 2002 TaxID=279714 RepID=B9Z8A4_9NEIS|nr:chromosome segregation protein SMC [Pseudogulbenkiania ferrooxidans]EEG07007.1 chromosome segregation protein SMC [Pseudogulbenkiania ferrooxidans 2002]